MTKRCIENAIKYNESWRLHQPVWALTNTASPEGGVIDAGAGDDNIHQGEFLGYLCAKYAASPRGMFVISYRNNSTLMPTRCHGAWSGKRAPSQSRMAMALKVCAHFHQSKDSA